MSLDVAAKLAPTIGASGFTPRQVRFLVLVLEHSGVCLPRQYRTFAGVAHGRQTHRCFEKLIRRGFATTDQKAYAAGALSMDKSGVFGKYLFVAGQKVFIQGRVIGDTLRIGDAGSRRSEAWAWLKRRP